MGRSRLTIGRPWIWLIGVALTGAVALLIPWPTEAASLVPVALFCLVGLVAAMAQFIAALRSNAVQARRSYPADAEPADGRVGWAKVVGIAGEPNRFDFRFRHFLSLDESPLLAPPGGRGDPVLWGRVVLFSLFVGRDGRSWSSAEIARTHKSLIRAGEWIEREAIRWSAAVNIELADTVFVAEDDSAEDVEIGFVPQGDEQGPLEARAVENALASASRAAARLGFADVADLVERIGPRVEADGRVWLVHPRRAGRSIAALERDSGLPGVNLAVCYAREAGFSEPLVGPTFADPVTFVHELMHLFGAEDKYGVPLTRFPRKSVTERDVMRLSVEHLSRLRVDPLTASEIGWLRAF